MTSNIYWINHPNLKQNSIGTMARPRGGDWLEDEIRWLKIKKVDCLVSLLESSEIWELELQKEKELCEKYDIEFINFPIKDIHIPKEENNFIELAKQLASKIAIKKNVVVHCRMGIGRSSILVASIMICLGFDKNTVFNIIEKYRKLSVPDTKEQKEWILKIGEKLKD